MHPRVTQATDPSLDRQRLVGEARRAVPEAFDARGRVLSPLAGRWVTPSSWSLVSSPIDAGPIVELPVLTVVQATEAVEAAQREFAAWAALPLERRSAAIAKAVALVRDHRDLLVSILAWEIGKTIPTAQNDVDRCLSGAEWYLAEIGPMARGRAPLGVVSNVASWNYPFSVLLLNVLVQALTGNVVIAKIPSQGGGLSLTLAFALLRRAGVPVSLAGGRGADLAEPLVGHDAIAALAFVGGRANGTATAKRVRGTGKRYALEMEGVNAYAVTDFSDWEGLAKQIRAGFDFGKQRCTAYTRWVVQRALVPQFVETYARVVAPIRVGHPLMGEPVDFGPLISAAKADELRAHVEAALAQGAKTLHENALTEVAFTPRQDRRAYLAPRLLTGVPRDSELYRREPFGPIDLLVAVDSDEELIREANVSKGALVASVATDDPARGAALAARLEAFKTGVNKLRSRGDKDEAFGGKGASWEGAFVGGANLVRAFTSGPGPVAGNWP